jgi:hypothetical protein
MITFLKQYRYYILIPIGLIVVALAVLVLLGRGSEGDVAFVYQLF